MKHAYKCAISNVTGSPIYSLWLDTTLIFLQFLYFKESNNGAKVENSSERECQAIFPNPHSLKNYKLSQIDQIEGTQLHLHSCSSTNSGTHHHDYDELKQSTVQDVSVLFVKVDLLQQACFRFDPNPRFCPSQPMLGVQREQIPEEIERMEDELYAFQIAFVRLHGGIVAVHMGCPDKANKNAHRCNILYKSRMRKRLNPPFPSMCLGKLPLRDAARWMRENATADGAGVLPNP
nr:salutaridinol 7-O-acetyltransferase-like [Ipomoea batatas]